MSSPRARPPTDLAAGPTGLWVAQGSAGLSQFRGAQTRSLGHVDAATGAVRATVPVRTLGPVVIGALHDRVAASAGAVWVVARDGSVVRVDAAGERPTRTLDVRASGIASAGDGIWVLTADATLLHVRRDGAVTGPPLDAPVAQPGGVAAGGGAVWVTDTGQGTLTRVDAAGAAAPRQAAFGAGVGAVVYGADAVWVAQPARGVVLRVDPETLAATAEVPVGGTPVDLAADEDGVWAAVAGPRSSSEEACAPLAGRHATDADVLVAADLPLRDGTQSPTPAMAQAIRAVLQRHGWRAGSFDVALRLCDASTAASGSFDAARCSANVHAYAADRRVVAEVGPYHSACAQLQVPVAAAAQGGPLVLVSPTATDPTLTTNQRPRRRGTFVRVVARDDAQARAAASHLAARGHRRVFVLDDGEGYGLLGAGAFQAAARAAGLEVVDRRTWRGRHGLDALARTVGRSRADAVWVGGLLDNGAGYVVRALRRALGPSVVVAGGEGLLPIGTLFAQAGPAARGVVVATAFRPPAALSPQGRAEAAQLARAAGAARLPPAALSAAQATEVVLDAIARSDGTRRGVARAVRATRLDDAPLGRIRFDAAGDLVRAPVALVRAERGGGPRTSLSTEGAALVAVR